MMISSITYLCEQVELSDCIFHYTPTAEQAADGLTKPLDTSFSNCSNGGGFPVRVRSVDGVVGVIVVSGLK